MAAKKDYLIELFLKCSQYLSSAKKNLQANENFLKVSFQSVDKKDFDRIMSESGINKFTKELIPIVDSHFSEEEITSLIEFFRSPIGKKIMDNNHLLKIQKVMEDILIEREIKLSRVEKT